MQSHAALVYRVHVWSIDTCVNKVSAEQYHVTISLAQVDHWASTWCNKSKGIFFQDCVWWLRNRFTQSAFSDLFIILKSGILSPPSLILPIIVECLILGGLWFHMKLERSLLTWMIDWLIHSFIHYPNCLFIHFTVFWTPDLKYTSQSAWMTKCTCYHGSIAFWKAHLFLHNVLAGRK